MANIEDFDITGSIRTIEKLKSELLKSVAELYESMLLGNETGRTENLADLLILVYLLSGRLGISPKNLDIRAAKQLKLELVSDPNPLTQDFAAILKHLEK